ncbi:hypothetical protein [Actinoplanes sp. NPDC005259]|uniref:hypothetical protein n=2 Tax=unclassified Actinoplanes TaxID=2626549 RepID=UPI0033AA257A
MTTAVSVAAPGLVNRDVSRDFDVRGYVVAEVGCAAAVVGRQIVGLSARVLGAAMISRNTPLGAEGLGFWIAFGSVFGLLLGVVAGGVFDNLALGVGLGLSLGTGLGVVVGSVFIARRNARDES